MRRIRLIALLASLSIPALATAAGAASQPAAPAQMTDSVQAVFDQIAEKFRKHTTVVGEIETHVMAQVPGGTVESRGKGTFLMRRGTPRTNVRMDMEQAMIVDRGGGPRQMRRGQTVVSDGETVYDIKEFEAGQYSGFKMRHQGTETFDVDIILRNLPVDFNLVCRPDATVDGTAAFVLESQPKVVSQGEPVVRRDYYFAKNSGLLLQRLGYDAMNNEVEQFKILNIRTGVELPDARFLPPENISIADMTHSQDVATTQPGTQILQQVPNISSTSQPAK